MTRICVVAASEVLRQEVEKACQMVRFVETTSFNSGRDTLNHLKSNTTNVIISFSDITDMHWSTFVRTLYTDSSIQSAPGVFFFERVVPEDKQHLHILKDYGVKHVCRFPADLSTLIQKIDGIMADGKNVGALNTRLQKAKSLFRDGMQEEARRTIKHLQKDHPGHLGVKAAALPMLKDDPRKFADHLLHLVESDPENYQFQFELMSNYLNVAQYGRFLKVFDNLMADIRNSGDSYWLSQLGGLCIGMRSLQLAEVFEVRLGKVVKDHDRWMLEMLRARINLLHNNIGVAKAHLDNAVAALSAENTEMLNLKAIIARRRGELEAAVTALLQAIALSPEDYRLQYNLALIQLERGDQQKAKEHLNAAVGMNPTYAKAVSKLRELSE